MTTAEERQAKREAERMKRLSAQLRANLAKRKSQGRARRAGEEDGRTGLPAVSGEADPGGRMADGAPGNLTKVE